MIKSYSCAPDPKIIDYVHELFEPEDEILAEIRTRCIREKLPKIQVGAMDGRHLEVLAKMAGAKKMVEIGSLGGYSGVCLLRGAGPGSFLHTFEINPKAAEVACESFTKSNFTLQATVHVGPALQRLKTIEADGPFDLIFIDADKFNYPHYLEWAANNLRIGGVVIGDNTFVWGRIAGELPDPNDTTEESRSVHGMRAFNEELAKGKRFRSTLLPTGEGLSVGVRIL